MENKNDKEPKQYPEGHFVGQWMAIGMAIFAGLGIALSSATDNQGLVGIGPALGVAVGLAIGQSVENKYKKEGRIRPLNEEEKKRKKRAGIIALIAAVIIAIAVAVLVFIN